MITRFRQIARIACALSMLACADESVSTAPAIDTGSTRSLDAASSAAMEPTPEELAGLPAEFQTAPSILSTRTIVGFIEGEGAWAQGIMEYLASDAAQEVTLVVRYDGRDVARKSARGEQSDFLPHYRRLTTTVSVPLTGACGHLADGHTQHRAWHKFLVGGWKFLAWGQQEAGSDGDAEQPHCPAPPPPPPPNEGDGGGSSTGEPYEGGCEACQHWLIYRDGWLIDDWWECADIEGDRCTGNWA